MKLLSARFLSLHAYAVKTLFKKKKRGAWDYYFHSNRKLIPDPELIAGKHLFYSKRSQELEKVVIDEIENDSFFVGKIITDEWLKGDEYVLCLYDRDDSRKAELEEKYRGNQNVRYGRWKSEKETRKEQLNSEVITGGRSRL